MASLIRRLWEIVRANLSDTSSKSESPRADARGEKYDTPDSHSPRRRRPDAEIPPEVRDAFAALEVPIGTDLETCRQARKRLSRQYHPDRWMDDHGDEKIAEEVTKLLNQALQTIEAYYRIRKQSPTPSS